MVGMSASNHLVEIHTKGEDIGSVIIHKALLPLANMQHLWGNEPLGSQEAPGPNGGEMGCNTKVSNFAMAKGLRIKSPQQNIGSFQTTEDES